MSFPRNPLPCKLVTGLICSPSADLEPVKENLSERLGEIDFFSEHFPFALTDYYANEMGHDLQRIFCVFKELHDREFLVEAKIISYDLEKTFSVGGRRLVNIDPGIVTLENFVLSTFKNYYHRIYLGKGVYGEITLYYMRKEFRDLPWTYPDYREMKVKRFLLGVRKLLYENTIGEGLRHGKEYDRLRQGHKGNR